MRLIETDAFPFEFLSRLAERESWRKEIHRPIYHVHKWWAKRLGSVFRGILLGAVLPEAADLAPEFYKTHHFSGRTVFDPFMGSGTTIGEAHKLGFTALGRDINPVAVRAVRTALGPMDRGGFESAFDELSRGVGEENPRVVPLEGFAGPAVRRAVSLLGDAGALPALPQAGRSVPFVDHRPECLPDRKPEVQVLCPSCGDIFPGLHGQDRGGLPLVRRTVRSRSAGRPRGRRPPAGTAAKSFTIIDAVAATGSRPGFRLYGKLVLTRGGAKEYLPGHGRRSRRVPGMFGTAAGGDGARGRSCCRRWPWQMATTRARRMSYNFRTWRDFFNDRQLLALGWLRRGDRRDRRRAGAGLARDTVLRRAGVQQPVRLVQGRGDRRGAAHVLAPHPEAGADARSRRTSGARPRARARSRTCSAAACCGRSITGSRPPRSGRGQREGPGVLAAVHGPDRGDLADGRPVRRSGRSTCRAATRPRPGLPDRSIDLVVTDPPFFDNVHYSELADFFHAWQQLAPDSSAATAARRDGPRRSRTRTPAGSPPSSGASSASAGASSRTTACWSSPITIRAMRAGRRSRRPCWARVSWW